MQPKTLPLIAIGCGITLGVVCSISYLQDDSQAHRAPTLAPSRSESKLEELRRRATGLAQHGKFAEALQLFEEGERQALASGQTCWAVRFKLGIATIQLKTHRYRNALETFLELKPRIEHCGDLRLRGAWATNLAWVYLALGDLAQARLIAEEAANSVRKLGDPQALAAVLSQQATLAFLDGNVRQGELAYRQVLSLADRVGDLGLQAQAAQEYGAELLRLGRVDEAEQLLLHAYRAYWTAGLSPSSACYRNLAWVYLERGQPKLARRLIERAFEVYRSDGRTPAWTLYHQRALVHWALGDHRQALQDLRTARASAERMRLDLWPSDPLVAWSGWMVERLYRDSVRLALARFEKTQNAADAWEALEAADQGRAVGLRQRVGEAGLGRDEMPPAYWEQLESLAKAEALLLNKDADAERRVGELEQSLARWELCAGLRARKGMGSQPLSWRQLQAALRPGQALLVWWVDEPLTRLWVVTPTGWKLHRLPGRSAVASAVDAYWGQIHHRAADGRAGLRLTEVVLGSAIQDVAEARELLLVLDGPLYRVPFASLPIHGGPGKPAQYAVERWSFHVLPGVSWLVWEAPTRWTGPPVIVADPVYNRADPRTNAAATRRWAWPSGTHGRWQRAPLELARLVGGTLEAQQLIEWAAWSPSAPVFLTGHQARFLFLRQALRSKPAVIHLATHVVVADRRRGEPMLAFAMDGESGPQLVGPRLVGALRIHAPLVVMTGCSGGTGVVLPGEGLWGLARAWVRAGAHYVVAALWPTRENAVEFWRAFYGALPPDPHQWTGRTVAEALRAAQLDALRQSGWRSQPVYWAPYFVYGLR